MSLIYKNIIGSTAVTLIDSYTDGNDSQEIASISLCNVHATDSVDVDLYYSYTIYSHQRDTDWNTTPAIEVTEDDDGSTTESIFNYYIIKNVTIPKAVTLNLDNLSFNNNLYLLVIKLSAADSAVDVIIDAQIQGTVTTMETITSTNTANNY
jgi:hypothetical protein|tara:strand:- start:73 stop:528 length:456 start_codon:yes stop_codon:yes gene_type:complete